VTDRTRVLLIDLLAPFFRNIFYHIVSGANHTKFGNICSIIADFHFLTLKNVKKALKKPKMTFFKNPKNASESPRGGS
jgi:hypothetical protein